MGGVARQHISQIIQMKMRAVPPVVDDPSQASVGQARGDVENGPRGAGDRNA
jgi:hypothetical protein